MSDVQLLTRGEAAQKARISPSTLGNLIRSGHGPTVTRIGGRIFFRPEHLVSWLDRCAELHEPDPATLFSASEAV
ncbi:MAG: helix-turn-helix domain-containing protein [Janthinobacterium lividum]